MMHHPTPHLQMVYRRVRGFTLAEILVVVAILGIMAAVIGVSIGSRDDIRTQAACRVLASDLQYMQSRAIVRRQPHYCLVGPSGGSLWFATHESGAWVKLTHPIDKTPFEMVFGANGSGGGARVKLKTHGYAGYQVFGFDETGTPILCDGAGNNRVEATTPVTFTLSSGTYDLVVRVEPITGEISIGP